MGKVICNVRKCVIILVSYRGSHWLFFFVRK